MRALTALSLALCFVGCKSDPTQLLVVIDSDLQVPTELSSARVKVSLGPLPVGDQTFSFANPGSLPASFGVASSGDRTLAVRIEITAIGPGGTLFTREITTRFRDGKTLRVPFVLPRGCRSNPSAAACVAAIVDPASLSEVAAGSELEPRPALGLDAGVELDATTANLDATAASPDAAPLIEDGGVPDGGAPDSGIVECRNSAQCANQAACIDAANSLACGAGSANCFCRPPCDPFSTVSPCNNGDSCYWFSFPPDNSGACVPLGTGGDLGEPCTTTFDGQGMETSNTCSAFKNFCLGGIPSEPSGTCSRYCTTSSNICGSLGDYQCIEGSAGSGFGRCVNTISTAMDIGDQCTGPASCDDMCSTQLDVCTAACPNDLDLCPRNTVCVYLPQEDWRCLKACVTDAECTPPGHICENVNPPGSPELKICRPPRCTMDSECAGATCRISSGFCQP